MQTMAAFGRDEMLAVVERSPAAAGAHDRDAWVGLFDVGGIVNDPVGSRPHVGRREIDRFYDTFIGPRNITFHRNVDVVSGNTVVRDVELEVEMSDKVTMWVPVHIRYDLRPVAGELRIERLAAYWELPGMIAQFLRSGPPAVPVSARLSLALLGNQGPVGALGFAQGFRRVGNAAKATAENFLDALSRGDITGARRYLDPQAPVDVDRLAVRLQGMRSRKYLAAGDTVAVALSHETWKGVGLVQFGSNRGPIRAMEVMVDPDA